jgi:pimeloyl-ACP methyl ester carboxylesterase
MNELPASLQAWMNSGEYFETEDVKLFFKVQGSEHSSLPWLVCFHGFPTSSWDWHLMLPELSSERRVLVFDFPGYGLSAKPSKRDYSLLRQLDAAEALMQHLNIKEFDLLSHDMGNSVACELLYRRGQGAYPFELHSLTMLNGGIYMDLHQPLLTQRLLRTPLLGSLTARLSSWRVFRHQYPQVYADPGQFDEEHYREQWALMLFNNGRRILPGIAGYMHERIRMGERWLAPLHELDLPLRLIWGKDDPIAVFSIAKRLIEKNPRANLHVLEKTGHYPQLESPEVVAGLI